MACVRFSFPTRTGGEVKAGKRVPDQAGYVSLSVAWAGRMLLSGGEGSDYRAGCLLGQLGRCAKRRNQRTEPGK